MHPLDHARSSARLSGGRTLDYVALHTWLDSSKATLCHVTHRALRHHTQAVVEATFYFGRSITNSVGASIPVEVLGTQHLLEDLGRTATAADWLSRLAPPAWLPSGTPEPDALARISALRFGGAPADYLPLHKWFLATHAWFGDTRHLAMRHHAFGIFEAEDRWGLTTGPAPTRVVAEAHVRAVLGRIPCAADWLRRISPERWMAQAPKPPVRQP